jgi:hypothetical protein
LFFILHSSFILLALDLGIEIKERIQTDL